MCFCAQPRWESCSGLESWMGLTGETPGCRRRRRGGARTAGIFCFSFSHQKKNLRAKSFFFHHTAACLAEMKKRCARTPCVCTFRRRRRVWRADFAGHRSGGAEASTASLSLCVCPPLARTHTHDYCIDDERPTADLFLLLLFVPRVSPPPPPPKKTQGLRVELFSAFARRDR